MTQINILSAKRKKERIKISNINDFKDALKREGYEINESDEFRVKEEISETLKVDSSVIDKVYTLITDGEITYKANDVRHFIDYVEKIIVFENEHNRLCKKISKIEKLHIDRIEYDRQPGIQEKVEEIITEIEEIKNHISGAISEEEKNRLVELEKEIDKEYLYAKDIELLKKMIIFNKEDLREKYNEETKIKTISIKIPKKINHEYIKPKKGTVEYHQHLSNNIPRMQRLIRNIDKYMKAYKKEEATFIINQSEVLQDSINIAVAIYNGQEFRAVSGSDEVEGYCKSPPIEKAAFKSAKVNKLGKLGIGYDRVNDSEKKILEEIHKQIEAKVQKNEGCLILYSKWEPCPSCYFVISQFCKQHPNIKVEVKYGEKYGE